jgi:hypothetical protein
LAVSLPVRAFQAALTSSSAVLRLAAAKTVTFSDADAGSGRQAARVARAIRPAVKDLRETIFASRLVVISNQI